MSWSRTNLLIVRAAERLGARAEPLVSRHTDYFMRLSLGERSAVISKTRSPFLTQVAQSLANNKFTSRALLRGRGLPCVEDVLLDETDEELSAAAAMIERCGRVVVKPNWGNRGIAVATDVRDLATFVRARERAQAADLDEEVVVEPYVAGTNLRIAVIGGQAVAAAEVQRPRLIAGASARRQVAALNRDPRRGSWQTPGTCSMDQIEPEEDLEGHLEVYGLDLEAPIPAGREVEITGDEAEVIDRTDEVDRGWFEVAEQACGWLGVDVGGVDLRGPLAAFQVAPRAGSAVLLEVNVLPALHLHALPTAGAPRPVFEAFVAYCLQLPGSPRARAQVMI